MKYAIVVAGGKGLRMGSDLPKQFLPIGGRPVLMHTLETFERAIPGICQILVLPHDQQALWHELCARHAFALPHSVVDGGATRFHSVSNGLHALVSLLSARPALPPTPTTVRGHAEAAGHLVAVHDGVRPFVTPEIIGRCFEAARTHGAAVPVVPIVETVRELTSGQSSLGADRAAGLPASATIDRSRLRLVQTPQVFRLDLLLEAYAQPYREAFTDDASVVEALGHTVALVDGNRENIKITTPFDLAVAEALLARN